MAESGWPDPRPLSTVVGDRRSSIEQEPAVVSRRVDPGQRACRPARRIVGSAAGSCSEPTSLVWFAAGVDRLQERLPVRPGKTRAAPRRSPGNASPARRVIEVDGGHQQHRPALGGAASSTDSGDRRESPAISPGSRRYSGEGENSAKPRKRASIFSAVRGRSDSGCQTGHPFGPSGRERAGSRAGVGPGRYCRSTLLRVTCAPVARPRRAGVSAAAERCDHRGSEAREPQRHVARSAAGPAKATGESAVRLRSNVAVTLERKLGALRCRVSRAAWLCGSPLSRLQANLAHQRGSRDPSPASVAANGADFPHRRPRSRICPRICPRPRRGHMFAADDRSYAISKRLVAELASTSSCTSGDSRARGASGSTRRSGYSRCGSAEVRPGDQGQAARGHPGLLRGAGCGPSRGANRRGDPERPSAAGPRS